MIPDLICVYIGMAKRRTVCCETSLVCAKVKLDFDATMLPQRNLGLRTRLLLIVLACISLVNAVNDDGDEEEEHADPPLIAFAKVGNYDAVKELIEEAANDDKEKTKLINVLDHKNRSALTWALRRHKPRVANLLIDEGIDVMHMDCQNHTALWWSLHRHEREIALKLIEKGVDVNTDRDHTYLYTVAVYGFDKIAKALVEKGADLDQKNERGLCPIDVARKYRRVKVVAILEKAMRERENAFEKACLYGYEFIIDQLLIENPDYKFDEIKYDGKTCFEWTKLKGNHKISKKLMKLKEERKLKMEQAEKIDL